MVKQYFKFLIYGSLGLVASLYIGGCQPSLPPSTPVYEVNGAQVCDAYRQTPTLQDDCNNSKGPSGYYYNPGSSSVFYRTSGGKSIMVERNVPRPSSADVGRSVPLSKPVITTGSGLPLVDNKGSVIRAPSSSNSSINTTPVRSTASFDAPGGKVNAGKTSSTSRGLSFGHSSSGKGGTGG